MLLTNDEIAALRSRIDGALGRGGLGPWERRFLNDMRARIGHDGGQTRLTAKQSHKLHQLLARGHAPFPPRPGTSSRRHRRGATWRFRLRRSVIGLALVMLGFTLHQSYLSVTPMLVLPGSTPQASPVKAYALPHGRVVDGVIRIIDGDTVSVGDTHFRLIGLNTPETVEPRCAQERALGMQAKERLGELLAGGRAELTQLPCACPPGTEGTARCNYGRSCAVLRINGTDVAETLVGEGLAAPFHCGATGCPPLPRPWCGEG